MYRQFLSCSKIRIAFVVAVFFLTIENWTSKCPNRSGSSFADNNLQAAHCRLFETLTAKPSSVVSDENDFFPLPCEPGLLDEITLTLPKEKVSDKTTCFRRSWFEQHNFSYTAAVGKESAYFQSKRKIEKSNDNVKKRVGIMIGCNSGFTAVNLLRLLSQNITYHTSNIWSPQFFDSIKQNNVTFEGGICSEERAGPLSLSRSTAVSAVIPTTFHCIEAMPSTAKHVRDTAKAVGWDHSFKTHNLIMGGETKEDVSFYNGNIGDFVRGIDSCTTKPELKEKCVNVSQVTLDDFAARYAPELLRDENDLFVDILNMDASGYDWPIMLGGQKVLKKVKYLEFQYHGVGSWSESSLLTVVQHLRNELNFACYWAGKEGKLWRITDCWQEYYEIKYWSHVACVNVVLNPELAFEMEKVFLDTATSSPIDISVKQK